MGVSWYHKPSTETEEIPNPNLCTLCSTWAFGGLGCGQPWTFPSPWLDQYHSQWTSLQSSLSCRYFFNSLFFISLLRPFKFGKHFCALQEKFEAKNLQEKNEREAKQKKARFHFLSRAACKSNPHSNEGHLCADKPPHRHSSVRGAPCWGAWEGLGFDASIEQWATTWTPTRCWGLPTKLRHVRSSSLRFFAGNAYTIHFIFVLFFGCLYFEQWWKGPLVV